MPDMTEKQYIYDKIKIGLASPEKIREWSHGEVKKPETINYRTLKPEKDGLFCEKIFGPSKDFECHCGKYKKIRYKGVVCDRCGVEITKASVRRERMGHIELAAPVSHIWYFKGIPSRIATLLGIAPKALEKVLYFAAYIVLDAGDANGLEYKQVLEERAYQEARETYGNTFRVGMGAEAIQELLMSVDLDKESEILKKELKGASGQKRAKVIKKLEVVEAFRNSDNRPEWMIMTVIPVIPPDLRPMVQLDGGRFATSDMNDLYRRIINRNNRLKKLLEMGAPDIIIRNEKRMLQEAVDALIDNGRRGKAVTGPGNRSLKSLSDMLKGKQGRFRQNLLGKRVDYSGRSVIVVGPELKIYQCGLPKEMAIELFKPFVMKELVSRKLAPNIKAAKKKVEKLMPEVWDVLEEVIREHPVMLNRAPTLHRLGIQAFEPILVEGKAIKLHPLVCTAFNADFDGDQMAVHLPLSVEAQAECRFLLLSPNNLLKPSDGGPVAVPSQDMVLGIYYLTQERPGSKGEGKFFKSVNEAVLAYENDVITLHSKIKVRMTGKDRDGNEISGIVESTIGRFIFNEIISQDLGFVDRSIPGNELKLEVDELVGKKELKKILEKCINVHGVTKTAETLDAIKALGYKYSTRAAMTVSISDMTVPPIKKEVIEETQAKVEKIGMKFRRGQCTEEERYKEVISLWKSADDTITKALLAGLDKYNNIFMMADSGARGSDKQIKQLAGMRGLMADTTGKTIELPIKSNFREGLDVLEYFISAHGARKGLSDTALRTADSGYLTRRLVDVSQEQIIRENDCCENSDEPTGMWVTSLWNAGREIESLKERITGRFSCEEIKDKDGNVIVKANHMITPSRAAKVVESLMVYEDVEVETEVVDEATGEKKKVKEVKSVGKLPVDAKVKIRTILTCRSHIGICAKCYGANMATGEPVQVGEAVGIIAAQSIGEPGTQLTMRTFHTGGVAGDDITQGLPRVEEIFEARKPKGVAIITEIAGTVQIKESGTKDRDDGSRRIDIEVTNKETGEVKSYFIPYGSRIKSNIYDGVELKAGDQLTEGSVDPKDILRVLGVRAVQDYMLQEVQKVYRAQGVEISDKHIEVIVRQMLRKVRIEDGKDSAFLPGTTVDVLEFDDEVKRLTDEGLEPPVGNIEILGITKASLTTNSFMSAASFQETAKVLTEAAIKGKVDPLLGLKENVIIGKLIPAGTGMKRYRSVDVDSKIPAELLRDEGSEVVIDELEEDDYDTDMDTEMEMNMDSDEDLAEEIVDVSDQN